MVIFRTNIKNNNTSSRQLLQKKKIISTINKSNEHVTIPAICKKLKLSVPTGTKLINELIKENIIIKAGKIETDNGRRPITYKVNVNCAYAIGIEILLKHISLSIFNINMEEVFHKENNTFILENTPECLNNTISFIKECINESKIDEKTILGVGIGITGRVNNIIGKSYNYFNFLDDTLKKYIEKEINLPTFIDNDTHVLGLAEQYLGKCKNKQNAIVVNLSRGLGIVIIANGEVVSGEKGFAGEFGHMQFNNSSKLCICGKQGCLGTEVSGFALEEEFKNSIKEGKVSLAYNENNENIRYKNIIKAALNGDVLSITLIQDIGHKLGKALGNIINLLNPETIIIGGNFAVANEILNDSIKTGMKQTTLAHPLRACKLVFSELGNDTGIKGAGTLVLKTYNLI